MFARVAEIFPLGNGLVVLGSNATIFRERGRMHVLDRVTNTHTEVVASASVAIACPLCRGLLEVVVAVLTTDHP